MSHPLSAFWCLTGSPRSVHTGDVPKNTIFTSPATGRTYWIDAKGLATPVQDEEPEYIGCECEIDWRCPLHAGQPTWLETRFDDGDDR